MFLAGMVCRMCAAIFLQMVLASGVSADGSATASAPSPAAALKAGQATLTLIPAHDIEHDYRPVQISVTDLDGDGTAEIIYVYTSTWTGGTSVQKNELVVMTALGPGYRRGLPAYPGTNRVDDEDHAAVRASGYAAQDSVHLPGALKRLEIIDGEIEATFVGGRVQRSVSRKHRRRAVLRAHPPEGTDGAGRGAPEYWSAISGKGPPSRCPDIAQVSLSDVDQPIGAGAHQRCGRIDVLRQSVALQQEQLGWIQLPETGTETCVAVRGANRGEPVPRDDRGYAGQAVERRCRAAGRGHARAAKQGFKVCGRQRWLVADQHQHVGGCGNLRPSGTQAAGKSSRGIGIDGNVMRKIRQCIGERPAFAVEHHDQSVRYGVQSEAGSAMDQGFSLSRKQLLGLTQPTAAARGQHDHGMSRRPIHVRRSEGS